jgi:hypothetical protein
MKSLILMATLIAATGAHAAVEYAAYNGKDSADTVIVKRDAGKIELLLCSDVFPGSEDPSNPNAAINFAVANCSAIVPESSAGLTTDVSTNYITGGTEAVVSVSQVYENPADAAKPGELVAAISTYMINTYGGNPVGANDTLTYTGVDITHDHAATPKISTVRITYELQAVSETAP